MIVSLALIVPSEHKAVADAVAVALGHTPPGDTTYVARLSVNGEDPVTHYGCHTAATEGFVTVLENARNGTLPTGPNWAAVGLTEQNVLDMCAALTMRVRPIGEYGLNFDDCLQELGLQVKQ